MRTLEELRDWLDQQSRTNQFLPGTQIRFNETYIELGQLLETLETSEADAEEREEELQNRIIELGNEGEFIATLKMALLDIRAEMLRSGATEAILKVDALLENEVLR